MVEKLIYLSHTRPGIAYAMKVVNIFMHFSSIQHIEATIRIVRYLKGTNERGILYKKNNQVDILAYTYSDWEGDRDGRKFTSKYFTFVGGNLMTWKNKKHKIVVLSSEEK